MVKNRKAMDGFMDWTNDDNDKSGSRSRMVRMVTTRSLGDKLWHSGDEACQSTVRCNDEAEDNEDAESQSKVVYNDENHNSGWRNEFGGPLRHGRSVEI